MKEIIIEAIEKAIAKANAIDWIASLFALLILGADFINVFAGGVIPLDYLWTLIDPSRCSCLAICKVYIVIVAVAIVTCVFCAEYRLKKNTEESMEYTLTLENMVITVASLFGVYAAIWLSYQKSWNDPMIFLAALYICARGIYVWACREHVDVVVSINKAKRKEKRNEN